MIPSKREKTLLRKFIVKKLDAGKAENTLEIDVSKSSSIADFFIITTGTSTRHTMALAHHLSEDLRKKGWSILGDCHKGNGNWVVVDAGPIVVHILTQEARDMYKLEDIWIEPKPKRNQIKRKRNA